MFVIVVVIIITQSVKKSENYSIPTKWTGNPLKKVNFGYLVSKKKR